MNDALNIRNIDYGIKRVIRFGENDENIEDVFIELKALELEKGASIVKIETFVLTRVVLLSNGEIYSKGISYLGRAKNDSEKKNNIPEFCKIRFFENDNPESKEIDVRILNFSTGKSHLLAIDDNSAIWGWGSNVKCQIDPDAEETSIEFPHRINRLSTDGDVIQVYAINDSSMCIKKENQIIIWGSPENGILGKDKIFSDPKNKKNIHFIAKSEFSEIIKNTILKDKLDFTEEYINSRKLFNTKYNQIKRDNIVKRIIINKLEEKKRLCLEDAKNNISKNLDNENKFQIEEDSNIQLLKKKISDFESFSQKLENKKKLLQDKIVEIDKEIKFLNNDHEKVVLKLAHKKSEIELKLSKRNKLENLINNTDSDKNLPTLRRELREVTAEIVNLTTLEESFTNNLELIVSSLDSKNNERIEISKQIADIIKEENEYIKYKYTLEDMIFIINDYHYKNTNGMNERRNTIINDNGNKSIIEQQKLFRKFNDLIVKIDEFSFLNLNSAYLAKGINLSTEMLLLESNKGLKEQKEKIYAEYELLENFKKKSIETIMTMTNDKLNILFEQNILISHLITMFKNMKKETIKYYNCKASLKKDLNNQTLLFEDENFFQQFNDDEKNKFIFNTYTKDLIINFLKEAINTDDLFLRNINKTNGSIRNDLRFDQKNAFRQIMIDNPEELDNNNNNIDEQSLSDENKYNQLDKLVYFKRKERKKINKI